MNQIFRFPDNHIPASAENGGFPAFSLFDPKIRGKKVKLSIFFIPDTERIPGSFFPDIRIQHRPMAVQILPVKAVPADGKINLLPVLLLSGKMRK